MYAIFETMEDVFLITVFNNFLKKNEQVAMFYNLQ